MKKIFLTILAVAVLFSLPMTAYGKADFELGGYIRMDAIWNSQQNMNYALSSFVQRSNLAGVNHGRFQMNANATRLNFTMKGPELWGGKVTGFIEFDFDGTAVTSVATAANNVVVVDSPFVQAKIRLRHAMFKIAWDQAELLFGQYWSINSELGPDTTDSGAYCLYGATQLRIPQVRFTGKFGDGFSASLAIEEPASGRWGLNIDNFNPNEGESSEMPMVEAKIRYEKDLWGKAAYLGAPKGFYVALGAGYFNTRSQPIGPLANIAGTSLWSTLGQTNFASPLASFNVNKMSYRDHWLFTIENFLPIIPTTSKNLAGTLSFVHQWWVGQGVSAWRLNLPANDRYYLLSGGGLALAGLTYDQNFMKMYGGWAQLQYYWKEDIYTNVNFGFEKAFGFNGRNRNSTLAAILPVSSGYVYANPNGFDPVASDWRVGITQWYRPIAAVKFGAQYCYSQTTYFQYSTVGSGFTNHGGNHTLMANAWYFF
jgi:hypothetical protein